MRYALPPRAINSPKDNGDIIPRQGRVLAGRDNNLLTSHARVMRRIISHPPTRSGYSHPPSLPFDLRTAADRVSAAIVIYRLDDLRFRLHRPAAAGWRYRTVSGRVPEVSSDSSTRDSSYILAGDSAAHRFTVRGISAHSASRERFRRICCLIGIFLIAAMNIYVRLLGARTRRQYCCIKEALEWRSLNNRHVRAN